MKEPEFKVIKSYQGEMNFNPATGIDGYGRYYNIEKGNKEYIVRVMMGASCLSWLYQKYQEKFNARLPDDVLNEALIEVFRYRISTENQPDDKGLLEKTVKSEDAHELLRQTIIITSRNAGE